MLTPGPAFARVQHGVPRQLPNERSNLHSISRGLDGNWQPRRRGSVTAPVTPHHYHAISTLPLAEGRENSLPYVNAPPRVSRYPTPRVPDPALRAFRHKARVKLPVSSEMSRANPALDDSPKARTGGRKRCRPSCGCSRQAPEPALPPRGLTLAAAIRATMGGTSCGLPAASSLPGGESRESQWRL